MGKLEKMDQPMIEVAVIGGGFCGLWSSLYLKEYKIDNIVLSGNMLNNDLEQIFGQKESTSNKIFHPASRLNCGLIMPHGYPENESDYSSRFLMDTYNEIKQRDQIDWRETGVLLVATNSDEFQHGVDCFNEMKIKNKHEWLQIMTKEEILQQEPSIVTQGGLLYKKSGTINPTKLLAKLENEIGIKNMKSQFEIVEIIEKNSFFEIISSDGESVVAKNILIATGAGTNEFCRTFFNIDVPVQAVRGTMWSTTDKQLENIELKYALCGLQSSLFYSKITSGSVSGLDLLPRTTNKNGSISATNHLYAQMTSTGEFICGGEREYLTKNQNLKEIQNQIRPGSVEANKEFISQIFPTLKKAKIDRSWSGLMPWTPDGNPIIGKLRKNIFVNSGLCSSGVMKSAGASKLCAKIIKNEINGDLNQSIPFCDPLRFNK